jgi:uncharacterized membrane protein YkoI
MGCAKRFALTLLLPLALTPARGEEPARPVQAGAAAAHACLDQKERRAEYDTGKVVRLGTAIRVAKSRIAGTVVRARLCRGKDGLVYVLTVLARDGKVTRLTVDAVKGTLVGGL